MEILNRLKKTAYYILVLSLAVCTVIRFINWENNQVPFIVPTIYNSLYFLRKLYSLPVLFISEAVGIVGRYRNKKDIRKDIWKLIIYVAVSTLIICFTKNAKLVYFATMIYFAKDHHINEILDVHIIGKLIVLAVLIYGNLSGRVYIAPQRGNGFGMVHYNTLSQFLMFLQLALCCRFCTDTRRKIIFTIASFGLMLFSIFVIDSRTPVVIILLFVVLLWLEKLYFSFKGIFKKIFDLSFINIAFLLTALSIVLGILVVDFGMKMDSALACRFTDFVNAFRSAGLSLFSRDLTYGQGNTIGQFYFDNHYAKMIFDYGIVLSCVAYSTILFGNRRAIKFNNYIFIVVMICVFVDGTSGGLFDNELLIVLMACMFSKNINDLLSEKGSSVIVSD